MLDCAIVAKFVAAFSRIVDELLFDEASMPINPDVDDVSFWIAVQASLSQLLAPVLSSDEAEMATAELCAGLSSRKIRTHR